jgi:hypothetical protein
VFFVVAEEQVEGSMIPEAIAIETAAGEVENVVPIAGVPEGVAPGPEARVAMEITEGVHVDVLPESSMDMVFDHRRSRMRNQSVRCLCQRRRQPAMTD